MDKTKKIDELTQKIQKGLELSYEKLVLKKRQNNQKIVIRKNGKIKSFVP